jgi:amino-acid N-acetyltransferase
MTDSLSISSPPFSKFVEWFRSAAPYIHAHRGRTFVICFEGEAVQSPQFVDFIHDVALLNSFGIRLVLVHGTRPQIEQQLQYRGHASQYVAENRVTDEIALQCVKAACGEVQTEIERLLSMGLSHSQTSDFFIRTATGNFIVAQPIGIRDGIDYGYTGEMRRVDTLAIKNRLDEGCIVLISPLGYSPTGEAFNLLTGEVAAEVAIALRATKWISLIENGGIFNPAGEFVRQITVAEAQHWIKSSPDWVVKKTLKNAIKACQRGVQRVHFLSRQIDGGLLLELFTRDGIGTLISTDPFENIRKAHIEDIGGLLNLIQPLEESGILVKRSREKLEMEINQFTIQERDGMIIACAALYPFLSEQMAELACLAVHPHYRGTNRGDALLAFLEREARELGIGQLFVLTTRTAHWFQERGFIAADLNFLPVSRQQLYNYQRKSKVFIKQLSNC